MTIERSDKLYESWRQATEKFDYFMLGLTGAICAYIAQKYVPSKLGLNPGTLELGALLLLVFAAVSGFIRIEKTMALTHLNHQWLRAKEEKGSLIASGPGPVMNEATGDVFSPEMKKQLIVEKSRTIPAIKRKIESTGSQSTFAYRARN